MRGELRFNEVAGITEDAARAIAHELAALAYDRPEGNSRGEALDPESLLKVEGAHDQAISAWRIDLEGGYTIVVGLIKTNDEGQVH